MTEVFVVRDAHLLAQAVAARLITRLVDKQASAGFASLLISDSPAVAATVEAWLDSSARDAVDVDSVHIWWANEAATAPTAHLVERLVAAGVSPQRLHPTAAFDSAEALERALVSHHLPADRTGLPVFDVALLELQASGGIAGIEPESPAVHDERLVFSVGNDASARLSMGLPVLCSVDEVWLLAVGSGSAPAAHLTLTGAGALQVPAAAVHGRTGTKLFLDEAAASRIPTALRRLASP